MKKRIILIFISIFIISGCASVRGEQHLSWKKEIVVGRDETQENIISFGGNCIVEGKVRENVVIFGGTLTLSGEVGDSVVGIGTDISLKETAVVSGDLVSIGGKIHKEPGCLVRGDTVYFEFSEVSAKFLKGIFSISLLPFILIIKLLAFFIWFFIAIIVASIFPQQISFGSLQVRKAFWPILGTGFLVIIIYAGLIIFSALLSFLLIGIPFLLALILIGLVIKIFGQVIAFYFFGESLSQAFNWQKISPLLTVIIGLVLVSLIGFIPVIGWLFSFAVSLLAWGAVIRTKFGTTENWFRRK